MPRAYYAQAQFYTIENRQRIYEVFKTFAGSEASEIHCCDGPFGWFLGHWPEIDVQTVVDHVCLDVIVGIASFPMPAGVELILGSLGDEHQMVYVAIYETMEGRASGAADVMARENHADIVAT